MTAPARRANNRNDRLLDEAARLFASQGYRETTMRDIAAATGMLPGSIYYHYPSKAELLVAVYEKGVEALCQRFDAVLDGVADPWERLGKALDVHMATVLDQGDYARVMVRVLPEHLPESAQELARLRDSYEDRIAGVIDALPVNGEIDPKMLRFLILGAANWAQTWYRPGMASPAEVARQFLLIVQRPMEASDG